MSQTWHTFSVNRTLLPHQSGTKRFLNRYGERLVCVRYRDDVEGHRKITTVDVVVEERPWTPPSQPIPEDAILSLRVEYGEREVGMAIRAAGGTWCRPEQVWKLRYAKIVELGLTDRIVGTPDHTME